MTNGRYQIYCKYVNLNHKMNGPTVLTHESREWWNQCKVQTEMWNYNKKIKQDEAQVYRILCLLKRNWNGWLQHIFQRCKDLCFLIRKVFCKFSWFENKTHDSYASSDNLQGLHHKTNNLHENLQLLNDNKTIVIWKDNT